MTKKKRRHAQALKYVLTHLEQRFNNRFADLANTCKSPVTFFTITESIGCRIPVYAVRSANKLKRRFLKVLMLLAMIEGNEIEYNDLYIESYYDNV